MEKVRDYKSENCVVDYLSDLTGEEAEKMIGKVVAKVEAHEYNTTIIFTDGSNFTTSGGRWGGCCMGAKYEDA